MSTKRLLFLVTDAHGGVGGIAQYNCDVIEAVSCLENVAEIVVVARIINHRNFEPLAKTKYVFKGSGSLLRYLVASLHEGLGGGPFDLIYCAHINLLPLAATIAIIRKRPLVLAIYGYDAWLRPSSAFTRMALRRVDLMLSISQITIDRFSAWAPKLRARVEVVPNAIRLERYGRAVKDPALLERFGLEGKSVIMTLGRMDPKERAKGFDEIIELMPRLIRRRPEIIYICAGDGGDRKRLEAKVRSSGLSGHVLFTGWIPESLKADYLRLADAYIMPSKWEGFGFVVLEALACGIPVVASAADGTREAVRDGELGLLVDPKDTDELEQAIFQALERPKAIPPGLDYFSFANFKHRLHRVISQLAPLQTGSLYDR